MQARVKELLHYNPETGAFTWKVRTSNRIHVGDVAGCVDVSTGYIKMHVDGKLCYAHRLAWLYMYGEFPEHQIDHENHKRDDNRIANLRAVTRQENLKNASMSKINTSGFTGVMWNKHKNRWVAQVRVNGKNKHLGYFANKQGAIQARERANIKYNFHENHGEMS